MQHKYGKVCWQDAGTSAKNWLKQLLLWQLEKIMFPLLHSRTLKFLRWKYCHGAMATIDLGKWKTLKCGNRSMETEGQKRKYGSEKKSRLSVFSALLTHECVCWGLVDKGGSISVMWEPGSSAQSRKPHPSHKGCGLGDCLRLEDCGERRYRNVTNVHVTADPNQDKRCVHGPTMWALCSWNASLDSDAARCKCCRSSSPMAQPATKLLQRH